MQPTLQLIQRVRGTGCEYLNSAIGKVDRVSADAEALGLAPGAVAQENAPDTAQHPETSGGGGPQGSVFEASAAVSASRAGTGACLGLRPAAR